MRPYEKLRVVLHGIRGFLFLKNVVRKKRLEDKEKKTKDMDTDIQVYTEIGVQWLAKSIKNIFYSVYSVSF